VPEALTVGLPTEVAVIVDVLGSPLAALAGTSTMTHTLVVAPAITLGVVVIAVVQVESRMVIVLVPPVEVIE
jgi:hypothetical protein